MTDAVDVAMLLLIVGRWEWGKEYCSGCWGHSARYSSAQRRPRQSLRSERATPPARECLGA